ncbi:MAG: M56 family metallopeptidase [Bacteroidaceae bacterium]|nr:M56 family metallopeptidase [Bacteroidaceae bacterium]MBP3833332.1 M56 family metallopeptidase [Bacteroidaceae bacterium]
MAGIITLLIKTNVMLAALCLLYLALFRRDTFFSWRRASLLFIYAFIILFAIASNMQWSVASPVAGSVDQGIAAVWVQAVEVGTTVEDTHMNIRPIIINIWLVVVTLLALRLLWQLGTICWLGWKSQTGMVEGVIVRFTKEKGSPFSFFRWIFINKNMLDDPCLHEVLLHEQTHARQWHSVDVMLSEVATILCWFNPFAWILRREVRVNLEFLADQCVVAKGHDARTYQYHLLALTYQRSVATLTNNFNVLPLKQRIEMMNKERSKSIGRLKYLLLLPVCALLFMMSSTPVSAQSRKSTTHPDGSVTIKYGGKDMVIKAAGDDVYQVVDEMPQFPGGMKALMDYLSANVKYPEAAKQAGISGRVTTQFVVGEDGVIRDVKVLRSVSPELDAEAIRVMSSMPKWEPGKQDGKPVPVRYTVPVNFRGQ